MTKKTVQLLYCDQCGKSIEEGPDRMYCVCAQTVEEAALMKQNDVRHFCCGKCLNEWSSKASGDGVPATLQHGSSAMLEGIALPTEPEAMREHARGVLQRAAPMSTQYENQVWFARLLFALADVREQLGAEFGAVR